MRASTGDETIYLFLDNAKFHCGEEVKKAMNELGIVPVWNVPYRFEFNEAIEKYWALLKSKFRPKLLERMLKTPRGKETPLKETLRDVIIGTPTHAIRDFVRRGLNFLRIAADDIREARGEERVHDV